MRYLAIVIVGYLFGLAHVLRIGYRKYCRIRLFSVMLGLGINIVRIAGY